jgi:hypothetical protein
MKRISMIVGVLVCVGAVLADEPAPAPGQVEFKFKFEPGRTIRQKLVSKTAGDIALLGSIRMQQTFEQVLTTRCRKVNPDRSAVFDVTLGDIVMKMSMGPVKIEFDSRTWQPGQGDPKTELIGKLFSALNGATFAVTVSPSGQPVKVEGLTEVMRKAFSQLGEGPEAQMMRKLFDDISSSMGDDMMADQYQDFSRMCPPKQGLVNIGEKWEHSWALKKFPVLGGSLQGKGEYQLIGMETVNGRPCAKIRSKETFSMVPPDKQSPPSAGGDASIQSLFGRMKMGMSMSGGDGIAYIDCEHGYVVKLRQTQIIEITMSIAADTNDPNEETRRGVQPTMMKMHTSVSLDLLEDQPGQGTASEAKPAMQPAND